MTENILVLPDTHYPDHDVRLWKVILRIVKEIQPDEILHIGDLMDYPQPSRWTKGTRAEFEGNVYEDSEKAVRDILEPLRDVYDGTIRVIEGNHDLRPRVYMEKYAPALSKTELFNFDKLLKFDDLGIEVAPNFYEFAPGWIAAHGHLGGIRLNQNAGMTALNAAKKIGKSLVMGHTHRAGICSYTVGIEGKTSTITGVEVGHAMDTKKVTYLKGATGNWQQGIALLKVDGKHVTPQLVPVSAGKLTIDERTFKI